MVKNLFKFSKTEEKTVEEKTVEENKTFKIDLNNLYSFSDKFTLNKLYKVEKLIVIISDIFGDSDNTYVRIDHIEAKIKKDDQLIDFNYDHYFITATNRCNNIYGSKEIALSRDKFSDNNLFSDSSEKSLFINEVKKLAEEYFKQYNTKLSLENNLNFLCLDKIRDEFSYLYNSNPLRQQRGYYFDLVSKKFVKQDSYEEILVDKHTYEIYSEDELVSLIKIVE